MQSKKPNTGRFLDLPGYLPTGTGEGTALIGLGLLRS